MDRNDKHLLNLGTERKNEYLLNRNETYIEEMRESTYILGGVIYGVKMVEALNMVVQTRKNLYDVNLMNGDICKVIGVKEDELVVRRLQDGHEAFVKKTDVLYATFNNYPF